MIRVTLLRYKEFGLAPLYSKLFFPFWSVNVDFQCTVEHLSETTGNLRLRFDWIICQLRANEWMTYILTWLLKLLLKIHPAINHS